jgi:hypothetical protein
LLLDERPLVLLPLLACKVGLLEAVVLQQIHYWLQRATVNYNGRPWVHRTFGEWQQELPFATERTLRRAIGHLRELGIVRAENLSAAVGRDPRDRRLYYSIEYSELEVISCPPQEGSSSGGSDANGQNGHPHASLPAPCKVPCRPPVLSAETTAQTTGRKEQQPCAAATRPRASDAAASARVGNQERSCGITIWTAADLGLIKALVAVDGEQAVARQAAENLAQGVTLGKDGMPLASGVAKALARKRTDATRKAAEADQHRRAHAPAEDSAAAARKAEAQMAEYARLRS